jgi:acylphosphatase
MSDYDSKIIRKQIRVYGSVQGVGFRYRTEHAAESVGATGWVRNDPDGSVFMEIQGTEEQIDRVFAMVSQGTYVNIEKWMPNQYWWLRMSEDFIRENRLETSGDYGTDKRRHHICFL